MNSSWWRLDEQQPVEAGGGRRWMNSSPWRLERGSRRWMNMTLFRPYVLQHSLFAHGGWSEAVDGG